MAELQTVIDRAWEERAGLNPRKAGAALKRAIAQTLDGLDGGRLRVAEKIRGAWTTHQWIKKAVLLSFRLQDNVVVRDGHARYFDKVPSKFARYTARTFGRGGFRVVPPAAVRRGAYIARDVVLMPSFVNIGAYVDEGTMVDTWATVGSCAQIGKNVHLWGCRDRRRAGARTGRADDHRGRLLHRRALRDRRGCRGRGRVRHLDGGVHRRQHPHLQSPDR